MSENQAPKANHDITERVTKKVQPVIRAGIVVEEMAIAIDLRTWRRRSAARRFDEMG
jgi:hypothetical protein